LLTAALGVRIVVTLLLLAPLGLCLGMFMPLGLGLVAGLSEHGDEYVAWSWAVNGFFSVIGSVLTTILAMTFGFRLVQLFALVVYAVAGLALRRLQTIVEREPEALAPVPSLVPA
jgi:MFS family permease